MGAASPSSPWLEDALSQLASWSSGSYGLSAPPPLWCSLSCRCADYIVGAPAGAGASLSLTLCSLASCGSMQHSSAGEKKKTFDDCWGPHLKLCPMVWVLLIYLRYQSFVRRVVCTCSPLLYSVTCVLMGSSAEQALWFCWRLIFHFFPVDSAFISNIFFFVLGII